MIVNMVQVKLRTAFPSHFFSLHLCLFAERHHHLLKAFRRLQNSASVFENVAYSLVYDEWWKLELKEGNHSTNSQDTVSEYIHTSAAAISAVAHEWCVSITLVHLIKSGVRIGGLRDNAVEYAVIASSILFAFNAMSPVFSKVAVKSHENMYFSIPR